MFGGLGLPELIVLAVIVPLMVFPAVRVCQRAGFSPWLGLVSILPPGAILLLWILALTPWPADQRRGSAG